MKGLGLRAGDWVEVRSKEEILRTLDKQGRLENMPFMPQMFAYCGQRMRVASSAHKTCDTITGDAMGRRLSGMVHLEGVRCDGAAHGGCEALCTIFWKEAWLAPVDGPRPAVDATGSGCTEADVAAGTRAPASEGDKGPTYVCQATEVLRASEPLPWWDFRQYLDDYRSGNVTLRRLFDGFVYSAFANVIRGAKMSRTRTAPLFIALYDGIQALRGGAPFPRRKGQVPAGQKTPVCALDLRPGDLVRVRSHKEILTTLDGNSKNRGLYFDAENVPFCGQTHRVLSRVGKIIDEKTGKMLELKNPSVILDGATCQSRYSNRRMFCPRAAYPYWREIWLERVNGEGAAAPAQTASGSTS